MYVCVHCRHQFQMRRTDGRNILDGVGLRRIAGEKRSALFDLHLVMEILLCELIGEVCAYVQIRPAL